METAAIVTTAANHTLQPVHHRMPVIVPPDAFDLWLDCGKVDAETAAALIVPAPDDLLELYEVSTAVNRAANDSAALIEPVSASDVAAAATQKPKLQKRAKAKSSNDEGQTSLF
jgi:putative SOS response-associated peptidase YedK